MKKILLGILCFASLPFVQAQNKTFEIKKAKGNLIINIPGIMVEGYDGNVIQLSTPINDNQSEVSDPRASGLKQLSGNGLGDNTGLGVSVKENGNTTEINGLDKFGQKNKLWIRVPNSIHLIVKNPSVLAQDKIQVKNYKGDVEIGTTYSSIELDNITGPLNAKSVYGNITSKFDEPVKGPISIVSVYNFVDVSIPKKLKANLNIKTLFGGRIYVPENMEIHLTPTDADGKNDRAKNLKNWNISENIEGEINGGGTPIILKSSYGKIYLRNN